MPDGMGRVDLAYARHFVSARPSESSLVMTVLGPRLVPNQAARAIVDELGLYWREDGDLAADKGFAYAQAALRGEAAEPPSPARRSWPRIARHALRIFRRGPLLGSKALFPGRDPTRGLPQGAIYLNVAFFPLWRAGYFSSLTRRPDVKPVFFLHDQLPVQLPEYFPPHTPAMHAASVERMLALAKGVIVSGEVTRAALAEYCTARGVAMPPSLVAPLPVSSIFTEPPQAIPGLAGTPYFVICGTIEPRKGHLLLLNIWREMVARRGGAAPKLVVVGVRGWHNQGIVDMLDRCASIRPHVIEVASLSTPALKVLLDHARALLMPSFGEGFGLPIAEALAAGTAVVASDIAAFRAFQSPLLTLLDPTDGPGWRREIERRTEAPHVAAGLRGGGMGPADERAYFASVEQFLANL